MPYYISSTPLDSTARCTNLWENTADTNIAYTPYFSIWEISFTPKKELVSAPLNHSADNFKGISVMPIAPYSNNLRIDWMSKYGRSAYNKLQRNATYKNVMIVAEGEKAKPKYTSARDQNKLMGRFCKDLIIADKKPYIRHRMFYLTGFGPEALPLSAQPVADDYYPYHFYPLNQNSNNSFMLNTATGMANIVGNKVDIIDPPKSIVELYNSGYYRTRTPTIQFMTLTGFEEKVDFNPSYLSPINPERLEAPIWGFYLDTPTTMTNNADYVVWMSLYQP